MYTVVPYGNVVRGTFDARERERVMGWIVGSEDFGQSGMDMVPTGLCHAVDLERGATACDRPAGRLRIWSEIPWQRARSAGLDQCATCQIDAMAARSMPSPRPSRSEDGNNSGCNALVGHLAASGGRGFRSPAEGRVRGAVAADHRLDLRVTHANPKVHAT